MSKIIACLFLCLPLMLTASCQSAKSLTETDRARIEEEVLAVHRHIIAAAEAADADAMFSYILDNEGVILQNGRFYTDHQSALNTTRDGFSGVANLDYQFDHEIIEVLSPDKALLKAAGTSTATTGDGREFSNPFCETVVFSKTPDGWKILHAHQSTPVR